MSYQAVSLIAVDVFIQERRHRCGGRFCQDINDDALVGCKSTSQVSLIRCVAYIGSVRYLKLE